MSESYRVTVTESVLRETPLTEDGFGAALELRLTTKADAELWVDERNQSLPGLGQLTLHTAHPNDNSDVDAYLVFRPQSGSVVD